MQLFSVILPVFALVVLGWVARRWKLVELAAFHGLREIVFFLAMPALLFLAIEQAPPFDIASITTVYFAAALTIFAFAIARLFRLKIGRAAMVALDSSYGNTVLIGVPIALAALGPDALPPMLAIIALHSAILLPLTGVLVELEAGAQRRGAAAIVAGTLTRTAKNPIIMSIMAGLAWRATGLPLPDALRAFLGLLGPSATPLALICLGGVLPPLEDLKLEAETIVATALKLAALPALVFLFGRLAGLPEFPLKVAILVGGMPTAANAFLIAHRNEELAEASAAVVTATTALSPFTLSILLQLVG